jgi:hypothetical protein
MKRALALFALVALGMAGSAFAAGTTSVTDVSIPGTPRPYALEVGGATSSTTWSSLSRRRGRWA